MFSQDIQGYSILVRKTFEDSNNLEGITLYDHTDPARSVTITADRGRISFSHDFRKLVMDLEDGEIHELGLADMGTYRRLRFERHRIAMDVSGFDFERSAEGAFSRGDRELSARQMMVLVDSLGGVSADAGRRAAAFAERDMELRLAGAADSAAAGMYNLLPANVVRSPLFRARQVSSAVANELFYSGTIQRQVDTYMVEIHKKYAIPVACVVFVLIGLPLGVMARRGGFGIAATLSLGFFVLYWSCLIGGEKLADRGIVSPFWGMWLANIILGILGIYLTVRVGREAVFIRWDALRRFLPRRWRAETYPTLRPAGP
jgi:lipopolysaccharide export system permease protein